MHIPALEKEIKEAYAFLRNNNFTISDEALDFILRASLSALIYPDFRSKDAETYFNSCKLTRSRPHQSDFISRADFMQFATLQEQRTLLLEQELKQCKSDKQGLENLLRMREQKQ